MKKLLFLLFSVNIALSVDCFNLPTDQNVLYMDQYGTVYHNFTVPVSGFQFNVTGTTVSGAAGGAAAAEGFTVSPGGSIVLGFSFTGATIPAGTGILTNLTLVGDATGLDTIVISAPGDVSDQAETDLCE